MIILFNNYEDKMFEYVKAIRRTVFIDEQGADESAVIDEKDMQSATSFAIVCENDECVATGRITLIDGVYKIGRVAVLGSQRGKGTGKINPNPPTLKQFCLGLITMKSFGLGVIRCKVNEFQYTMKEILVDAQLHAVQFYEKLGFTPTGDSEIWDIGIRHLPMRKDFYGKEE